MGERNSCRDLGCPAACCRNIHGQVAGSKEFFLKAFPDAFEVTPEEDLIGKIKNEEHGVYFYVRNGWVYFSISGNCPNLTENLDCACHSSRFYPNFCRGMKVDSLECYDSREIFKVNSLVWK
jgi:hypothetical protein